MRLPWQTWAGAALVAGLALAGVFAPLLTSHDPLREWSFRWFGERYLPAPFPPGETYPLGSDLLGRDIWANLVYGARLTLGVAAIVVLARLAVGATLGALSGWFAHRWADRLLSLVMDAFAAFPTLLFALLWILAFDIRSGAPAFAIALTLTGWWGFGRTVRGGIVAIRGAEYLEAARALGLSSRQILVRHVAPNVLPLLAVAIALDASAVLLVIAELGFLGYFVGGGQSISVDEVGTPRFLFFPATPEWGGMIAQGRNQVLTRPWILLYPALAFALAILGFNLLGHGLRRLLERNPIGLTWLFRRRIALATAAFFLATRLALPNLGAAATYAPVAASFDGERARAHLAYLADPARGGRLTGSTGYGEAALYVAARFREIGLAPGGDGDSFFQRFETTVVELAEPAVLELVAPERLRFAPRDDFVVGVGGRRGGGVAEGQIVYVGGGIHTREYSDYRDVDVRGKVALVAGPTRGDVVDMARRLGAVAVLFVARDEAGPLIRPSYIPVFEEEVLPTLSVSEAVADRLIAGSGKRIADLRRALEERRRRALTRPTLREESPEPLSFGTESRVRLSALLGPRRDIVGTNVIGLFPRAQPGADERDRYVIVGAHLDGIGTDADGAVFPAANDNAAGVAVVIEVARAVARERDRLRAGVVFVAFAGEEQGLRGSEQFLQRSLATPYRPQNLAAMLNLDVVGCCGDTLAASEESFGLHARLAAAAERHGIPFTFTRGSSDHLTFVRRQVPAVMLAWADDLRLLHKVTDTVERIDAEHLRRAGVVAAQAVLELAVGE